MTGHTPFKVLADALTIRLRVRDAVAREQARQREMWGEQNHTASGWLPILVEEIGEVAKDVNELLYNVDSQEAQDAVDDHLHMEIIHVAAVAMSWLESKERWNNANRS